MPTRSSARVSTPSLSSRRWLPAASVLLLLSHPSPAAPQDPFASFVGSWRGVGHIAKRDGGAERITCRATYATSDSEASLSQSLVCASDSFRVNLTSYLVDEAGAVKGHWEESTRQAQGGIDGQLHGGSFEGSISGPGFAAALSLKATGKRQVVSIKPEGGDVAGVDIALTRDR